MKFEDKNCNMIVEKMMARWSKAVWNFSENLSVLETPPMPNKSMIFIDLYKLSVSNLIRVNFIIIVAFLSKVQLTRLIPFDN